MCSAVVVAGPVAIPSRNPRTGPQDSGESGGEEQSKPSSPLFPRHPRARPGARGRRREGRLGYRRLSAGPGAPPCATARGRDGGIRPGPPQRALDPSASLPPTGRPRAVVGLAAAGCLAHRGGSSATTLPTATAAHADPAPGTTAAVTRNSGLPARAA